MGCQQPGDVTAGQGVYGVGTGGAGRVGDRQAAAGCLFTDRRYCLSEAGPEAGAASLCASPPLLLVGPMVDLTAATALLMLLSVELRPAGSPKLGFFMAAAAWDYRAAVPASAADRRR